MKIFLVGPVYPYRGGIAHFNTSLAQALDKAGHQVKIISFKQQYPSWLYPGESDKDPSEHPLQYPAHYFLAPLYPWTWLKTIRYIHRERPQLVIFHWWTTFWAPAYTILAWHLRKKFTVTFLIHNVIPHEPKILDRWLAYITLRQGNSYIVQAHHEMEKLSRLVPNATKVFYSPLPVFKPFQEKIISKRDARKQCGIPEQVPVLLFFGIVRPYKGLKYLIEALAQVTQPVHLIVAGEFWEEVAGYQDQIKNLGIADHITLINQYIPNERAHIIFSAVDGLVAPYIGGTQSAAVSLALGYGLPMIITEHIASGLPENNQNFGSGDYYGYTKIVPTRDSQNLAIAIDDLITKLPHLHPIPRETSDDWCGLVNIIEKI